MHAATQVSEPIRHTRLFRTLRDGHRTYWGIAAHLAAPSESKGSKIRWLSFKSLRNQITSIRVVFAEIADLSLGASRLRIRFLHKLPVLATQIPGTGVSVLD